MILVMELVGAAFASAAVALDLYLETRRLRVAACAVAILASGFVGGGVLAAALALGILGRRVHPSLVVVPSLICIPLGSIAPLAASAAWLLSARTIWSWFGLFTAGAMFFVWPVEAAMALAAGVTGRVLDGHPANANIARAFAGAAPWMLPVPALGLLAMATLHRAATGDWVILHWAALAAALGAIAAAACMGVALRFLATGGIAGPVIAAGVAIAGIMVYVGTTGGFHHVAPATGLLLVPLVFGAGPFFGRLGPAGLAVACAVPVVAAL